MGIDQLGIAGQRHRHRVDREVAAGEVGGKRRRANLGEGAGTRVGLAAGRRQVDLEAVEEHGRGGEALVAAHLPAQAPGQLGHLALDRDVDVRPVASEQEIAHGAAHQIGGQIRGRLAQALDAGKRRQALGEPLGLDLRL